MTRSLKTIIRNFLGTIAPQTLTAIQSARSRKHSHRLVREWGLQDLNLKLIERYGSKVISGPFVGMTLTEMTHLEHLGPFLLGSYESELHPWLERIALRQYSQILDVGAKFGYYAVGLARRMPTSKVIAFDTDWWARTATAEMATANSVPNVVPSGFCSPRWLNRHLLPNAFLFSDCEGYEGVLFEQARTTALDTATLLIEIHDELVVGVGASLRVRFARTHTVESVLSQPREPIPELLEFLTPAEAASASREYRGPQEWLLFTPRGEAR